MVAAFELDVNRLVSGGKGSPHRLQILGETWSTEPDAGDDVFLCPAAAWNHSATYRYLSGSTSGGKGKRRDPVTTSLGKNRVVGNSPSKEPSSCVLYSSCRIIPTEEYCEVLVAFPHYSRVSVALFGHFHFRLGLDIPVLAVY